MKHCSVRVIGKVQGVAFRYYTKLKAEELGLLGSTENLSDGSVSNFVFGNEKKVDEFIEWCKVGSPASDVKDVIVVKVSASESRDYKDFSILR